VLALAGGALGVALAHAGVRLLVASAPATLPRVGEITLAPVVIAFAAAVSVAASVFVGAIAAARQAALRESSLAAGTRGATASRERQRTRSALVVVQVALAVVLLVSSGLMIRTFRALQRVEPGFTDVAALQTARVWFPPQRIEDVEQVTRIQQQMLEKIAALPGVRRAGFASAMPLEAGRVTQMPVSIDGRSYPGGTPPLRRMKSISPGYFGAIGTRLIAGRDMTWDDIYGRARVAIVSESFAREGWGSAAAALGRRIHEPTAASAPIWRVIVGVVQDVHEDAMHQPAPAMVYFPVFMDNFWGSPLFGTRAINFVIRSDDAGSEGLLNAVRSAVWSVNSGVPVFLTRTMKDLYGDSMAQTSFTLVMLAITSTMALGLGIIGVYGVLSYVVSQRTREIGIRLALGAEPRRLLRMFVQHGILLSSIGIVAGLTGAVALTRFMATLLYGIDPIDLPTYGAVLLVVVASATLASYIPARRAAAMNPVATLAAD
jgi:putative ABC transport system permease protein